MKKTAKIIFGILLCIVLSCVAFAGCSKKKDNEAENSGVEKTGIIKLNNSNFREELSSHLGPDYAGYTFELTENITLDGDWKPLGLSLNHAFCGKLISTEGQHYTISGLKLTGWDDDGTPKYIAKQVIGWKKDGTPVYKSSEIIGINFKNNSNEVVDIIREGDDKGINDGKKATVKYDPNYKDLEESGTFEEDTAFGSVGLFGYTKGATFENFTVEGADFSFYAIGEYTYAGIISGYDVSSTIKNVSISNCSIKVSTIYDRDIEYDTKTATPVRWKSRNVNKQYIGGIVGYSKSNTLITDGKVKVNSTVLNSVSSKNFMFDNLNYVAVADAKGLEIREKEAILVAEKPFKAYYQVENIKNLKRYYTEDGKYYPAQVMVGGIAGSLSGASLENVSVDGVNQATIDPATPNVIERNVGQENYIIAKGLYEGGISAGLYNSTVKNVSVKNIFTSSVKNNSISLLDKKATVGGAFADTSKAVVCAENKKNEIDGVYVVFVGREYDSICVGGVIGFADNQSEISSANVKNTYFGSDDIGSNGLSDDDSVVGAILAGSVGVLRNSKAHDLSVDTIKFWINGNAREDEKKYVFANGIVSQAYGNSSLSDATATNVHLYQNSTTLNAEEYNQVLPMVYKNNYVNENGFTCARLYYTVNGRYDNVYVTVFAEEIPEDKNRNALFEEEIFKPLSLTGYSDGQEIVIPEGKKYFRLDANNIYVDITQEGVNTEKEQFMKYDSKAKYAEKITAYKVEFKNASFNQGKDFIEYDFDKENGTLTYKTTTDKTPQNDKTYYVLPADGLIQGYYLDVTVYTESGKVIVCDQKDADDEDDDVLAEARYSIGATKLDAQYDNGILLSIAETYINTFFKAGEGFLKDSNNFTIKYYDSSIKNRDFSKYQLVEGRPKIDNESIKYN